MYKTILIALDVNHESSWVKAVPTAAALADAFGADLHVMSVAPGVRSAMAAQHFPANFQAKSIAATEAALKAVVAATLPGRKVTQHIATGRIYRSILRQADAIEADLIVMASHRPELQDALIGPNADLVMRHAKASMLIVRE